MQEMKLIDAVAAETAIKDFFKKQIDEEYLYLEATDCNADISAILNALPEVPAVPLDVHERMKRELNNEIICLKAEIEDLKIIKQNALEIISTGQKQMLEIRNNSIKEFAERLKQKRVYHLNDLDADGDPTPWIDPVNIDNLVKEMAGE